MSAQTLAGGYFPACTGNQPECPDVGTGVSSTLNPALLRPTWHCATAPGLRGLVSGTQGTRLRVCPAAGEQLGAVAPDQLFREVHRDTFADGMAVFCNANGRRDDGRMEGESRRGKPGWDGNKTTRKQGTRKMGCALSLGECFHCISPPPSLAVPPFSLHHHPSQPFSFSSERYGRSLVRAGPVCDRQRGLSGSWPPGPLPRKLSLAPELP